MYVSRDNDEESLSASEHFKALFYELRWKTPEIEVAQMLDKVPLAEYLRTGLVLLN